MSMIEKVARAISSKMFAGEQDAWMHHDEHALSVVHEAAVAAIEAMREPTLEMRKVSTFEACERDWPAMINEALK